MTIHYICERKTPNSSIMKTNSLLLTLLLPLSLLAQSLPEERIFVVSDRLDYTPGDSIGLEGKLISNDSLALPFSRFVYVELFNEEDSVMERQKLLISEKGEFSTKIQVNPLIKQGFYYIRAFTKFMANFSERTFPIFPVRLGVKEQADEELAKSLHANFFPEGGHLVNGQPQNVGIYLTDGNRHPVQAEYVLTDNQGDTLTRQTTTPSGWQILSFTPHHGKSYHLNVSFQGEKNSILLPEAYDSPIVQVIANRGRMIYRILQPDETIKEGKLYVYHHSSGLQILPIDKGTGMLSLTGLSEGAVTFLLENNQGRIISQTSQWHSPTERENIVQEKENYVPGEKIAWNIANEESNTSVFVRVLPETMIYVPHAEHLLGLEHDLQSTVQFPIHYELSKKSDRQKELQGWLYSAWFKKFDVPRTVREGMNYRYKPEVNMQIQGQVDYARAPLSEGTLVAYNRENGQTFDTVLDKEGKFVLQVGDFRQGESFFVQAYSKHGKADIYDYEMSNDTLPGISNWNRIKDVIAINETGTWNNAQFDFDGINELPEVIVKARVIKEQKDKFTSERFNGKLYLDSKAMEERSFQSFADIVQYFHNYMQLMLKPNEDIDEDKTDYRRLKKNTSQLNEWSLFTRRPSTLGGKHEIKILIDGAVCSATEAMNMIVVEQLKSVEFLKPGRAMLVTHGAINGALVIETKGYEKQKIESKGIQYLPPMGISNMDVERPINHWKVPTEKGKYNILVDIISARKGTQSYVFPIVVE